MKKILVLLSAAVFALASCAKFESDITPELDKTAKPSIICNACGDSSIVVTIATSENAGYYSYAFAEGEAEELDPTALLKNKYASSVIASAVLNAADSTSAKLTFKNLDPNTTYTVYAVAASTTGVLTPIATLTKKTTDTTLPVLVDFSAEVSDGVLNVGLLFDDTVVLGEGKLHAAVWAINTETTDYIPEGEQESIKILKDPVMTLDIPADSIAVNGSLVLCSVPKEGISNGAFITVTYDAGLVKNVTGEMCEAYDLQLVSADGTVLTIGDRIAPAEFTVTPKDVVEPLQIDYYADSTYYAVSDSLLFTFDGKGSYFVNSGNDSEGAAITKKAELTQSQVSWDADGKTISAVLPFTPIKGEAQFDFAAGAFTDLYGNTSCAFTIGKITVIDKPFDIKFTNVAGCNSIHYSLSLSHDDKYFILDYFDVSELEDTDTPESLLLDDIEYIKGEAAKDDKSFIDEFLENFAYGTEGAFTYLNSENDYLIAAAYFDVDGKLLSKAFTPESYVKTTKFEAPSETTGSYTYGKYWEDYTPYGAMPVAFDAVDSTFTISGWGYTSGSELKLTVDKEGYIYINPSVESYSSQFGVNHTYVDLVDAYGPDYYGYNFYDSVEKTIYLFGYYVGTDPDNGEIVGGFGPSNEQFVFDNSTPAPTSKSCRNALVKHKLIKGKNVSLLPAKRSRKF